MLHQGLWPVLTALVSNFYRQYLVSVPLLSILPKVFAMLPFWDQIVGPDGGAWVTLLLATIVLDLIRRRVRNEEIMMRSHFHEEWDLYASKRWRFIPLVF